MRTFIVTLALVAGCTSTDVQKLPIGSACTTTADCGTGKFFCASMGHPGGYCKADCKVNTDCPSGSVCVGAGMIASGACHKACTGDTQCRASEGYTCKAEDASSMFCDPAEAAPGDGG